MKHILHLGLHHCGFSADDITPALTLGCWLARRLSRTRAHLLEQIAYWARPACTHFALAAYMKMTRARSHSSSSAARAAAMRASCALRA